ncbi:hypothetical protein CC85DRAFT_281460 [Cutaneotrichosporon oleaginosum]|uniref:Phosphatidylglycerol lysyltransferase C-terminal domain-containing protein n=1 Tax=Cutaneotrichosporon oleaginosum TaxID=879819 RepID=A0A0J0XZ81_9TREE|nr:uncharacterized protein CC85DRAFT_281460 [Cutaneotrichosporon oleaginosum]KLT46370.1 hypothetical protein CC85DRAFT_281460 [Cutaneotrichosporon oleaginosum]TXT15260.1 hypothetical protein COLE_01453 [Cutaneotrichosporon oleaginosum]
MATLTIPIPPSPHPLSCMIAPSPTLTPTSIDEPFSMLYKATSGDSAATLVECVDSPPLKRVASQVPSFATTATTSASVTLDGDAPAKAAKADKASAKAAKRKARRDLNKASRKAEATAATPKPQPWEVALGNIGYPASEPSKSAPQIARPTRFDHAPFAIPSEIVRGLLVPKRTFELSCAPAVAAVERLVAHYGAWSITFADPSYRIYLSPALDIAISFKLVRSLRIAVAFGDPACHPARLPSAIAEFHAFCAKRRWGVAFVAARGATAKVAQVHRWATVQFAVEQIVDAEHNPVLDGRRGKRQTLVVKKLMRDAPVRLYRPADGRDAALEVQLQKAYETVYAAKEERDGAPYSTKLHLFALPHLTTVLYTTDANNEPQGLVSLLRVGEGGFLLDPLVATPSAPPGTTDYLTVLAMGYARRRGASLSFGTEPTSHVGEVRGMRQFMEADTRLVHAATYTAFGMAGKKMLHDKFHPSRAEPLHLVLCSDGVLGQSAAAAAVWKATHLHCRPVVRPATQLVQQHQAGELLEAMLACLAERGQLRPSQKPYPSGSDAAGDEPPEKE